MEAILVAIIGGVFAVLAAILPGMMNGTRRASSTSSQARAPQQGGAEYESGARYAGRLICWAGFWVFFALSIGILLDNPGGDEWLIIALIPLAIAIALWLGAVKLRRRMPR